LTRLEDGRRIMSRAMGISNITGELMLPESGDLHYHIDRNYIMAALGVLSKVDRESALRLLREHVLG